MRVELVETGPVSTPAVFEALVGPAELRFAVGTDTAYVGALVAAIARAARPC